jgi:predicted phage terminase large subunit-like protein
MLTLNEVEELEWLLAQEELRKARESLQGFARAVMPSWQGGHHLDALCAKLEAVERGECKRLLVTMPPRHGKSQTTSILFPAWALGRNPRKKFIVSSYGADLAQVLSRETQRVVDSEAFHATFPATGLNESNVRSAAGKPLRNVDQWEMVDGATGRAAGGGYKCVGVGGSLTGHGGDVLIVDDPYKNRAEANSPTIRAGVNDWYKSTLRTRLAPGGAIIIIATRWHPDDLTGMLRKDADGERWEVLDLPAIDEQGRALWPERWPLEELNKIKAAIGRHEWASLYQGQPTVRGGNVFKVDRIRREDASKWPALKWVRCWDMASTMKQRTGDDPDWTCGVLGAITKEKDGATGAMLPHLWIRDVQFLRHDAPARNARIKAVAESDGPAVQVCVESFAAYKDAFKELQAALMGSRGVRGVAPKGDKMVKAAPLEPIFEAGNVHVPEGAPWLDQWLQHFEEFPTGAHEDGVDATALVWHSQTGGSGVWLPGS